MLFFGKPIDLSMQKLHLLFIIFNQHILVLDDLLIVFDGLTALLLCVFVLFLELLDLNLFQWDLVLETLHAFLAAFLADLLELSLQAHQLLVKCFIDFLISLALQRDFLHLALLKLNSVNELANVSLETADDPAWGLNFLFSLLTLEILVRETRLKLLHSLCERVGACAELLIGLNLYEGGLTLHPSKCGARVVRGFSENQLTLRNFLLGLRSKRVVGEIQR